MSVHTIVIVVSSVVMISEATKAKMLVVEKYLKICRCVSML